MHYRAQRNIAREHVVDIEVAKLNARQHRAHGDTRPFKRVAFIDKTTGRVARYA